MKNSNKWIQSNEADIFYTKKPNMRNMFLKARITRFGNFQLLSALKYEDLPDEIKGKVNKKVFGE